MDQGNDRIKIERQTMCVEVHLVDSNVTASAHYIFGIIQRITLAKMADKNMIEVNTQLLKNVLLKESLTRIFRTAVSDDGKSSLRRGSCTRTQCFAVDRSKPEAIGGAFDCSAVDLRALADLAQDISKEVIFGNQVEPSALIHVNAGCGNDIHASTLCNIAKQQTVAAKIERRAVIEPVYSSGLCVGNDRRNKVERFFVGEPFWSCDAVVPVADQEVLVHQGKAEGGWFKDAGYGLNMVHELS